MRPTVAVVCTSISDLRSPIFCLPAQLRSAQVRRDRLAGLEDVGDVRFAVLIQRCWNADNDCVDPGDAAEIARGSEALRLALGPYRFAADVLDITLADIEVADLGGIDIKPKNIEAGAGELQ